MLKEDALSSAGEGKGRKIPELLTGSADGSQTLGDGRIQADDSRRQLINRSYQRQSNGGDNQSVFHQILAFFLFP